MTTRPAIDLTEAFNACDPSRPLDADDPRYVDLEEGRGDEGSAVGQCRTRILRSHPQQPLVQLLAGHRGCGKSTELRRLKRRLEDDGYFVAYFEADDDLDLEDTESTDVLLAIVGHPRHLMILVRHALDFIDDDPPITKRAAHKAFRRVVNNYSRSIPEAHWDLLARVYRDQTAPNDEEHQLMLFNLSVLEYQNEERWCDVHPAILELSPFQAARKRLGDDDADGDS